MARKNSHERRRCYVAAKMFGKQVYQKMLWRSSRRTGWHRQPSNNGRRIVICKGVFGKCRTPSHRSFVREGITRLARHHLYIGASQRQSQPAYINTELGRRVYEGPPSGEKRGIVGRHHPEYGIRWGGYIRSVAGGEPNIAATR